MLRACLDEPSLVEQVSRRIAGEGQLREDRDIGARGAGALT